MKKKCAAFNGFLFDRMRLDRKCVASRATEWLVCRRTQTTFVFLLRFDWIHLFLMNLKTCVGTCTSQRYHLNCCVNHKSTRFKIAGFWFHVNFQHFQVGEGNGMRASIYDCFGHLHFALQHEQNTQIVSTRVSTEPNSVNWYSNRAIHVESNRLL